MSIGRNMAFSALFQCFATPFMIYFMIIPQLLYFATMIEDVKTTIHQFDYEDNTKIKSEYARMIQFHMDSLE